MRKQSEMDLVRLFIGARDGEDVVDALLRYTAKVQLRAAEDLEAHANSLTQAWPTPGSGLDPMFLEKTRAALIGGAAYLRRGLPPEPDEPTAIERWREAELQDMKDQLLGPVLERWWTEAMGELPNHRAKERLREIAEEHLGGAPEPDGGDTHEGGPTTIDDEQPRPDGDDRHAGGALITVTDSGEFVVMKGDQDYLALPSATDEGRAPGCLDPMCGDCDLK